MNTPKGYYEIELEDGSIAKCRWFRPPRSPEEQACRAQLAKRCLQGTPEERVAEVEKRIAARRAMNPPAKNGEE